MEKVSFILTNDVRPLVGEKTSWQPEKEEDDFQGQEQDMTNNDDLESEVLEPPDEPLETTSGGKESLHRSSQTRAP